MNKIIESSWPDPTGERLSGDSGILPRGLNFGSGKWSAPDWIGYDFLMGHEIDPYTDLVYANESIQYAYSSHFIEHVCNDTVMKMFTEVHRVLKVGGVLRILVPNFDLLLDKYKFEKKYNIGFRNSFFYTHLGFHPESVKPNWKRYNVDMSLENILLHFICNLNYKNYGGPPLNVDSKEVYQKCHELSNTEFYDWCQNLAVGFSPIRKEHINWWTPEKITDFFHQAGFSNVVETKFGQSQIPEVSSTYYFDFWNNGSNYCRYGNMRENLTLCMEAIKTEEAGIGYPHVGPPCYTFFEGE